MESEAGGGVRSGQVSAVASLPNATETTRGGVHVTRRSPCRDRRRLLLIGPELRFGGRDGSLICLHGTDIVCALVGIQLCQRTRECCLIRLQNRLRVLPKLVKVRAGFHVREAQPCPVCRHRGCIASGFVVLELLHKIPYDSLILLDRRAVGLNVCRERGLGHGRYCGDGCRKSSD